MQTRYLRIWVVMLLALFAFTVPRYAFALDRSDWKVVWGPNVIPGPASGGGGGGHPIDGPEPSGSDGDGTPIDGKNLNGVLVAATNKYYAALMVCGVSPNDKRLTIEVQQKLSNSGYGGKFYELAQRFNTLASVSEGVPDFYGASRSGYTQQIGFQSACVTYGKLYGKSFVYYAMYTDQQLGLAKRDLEDILDGGEGSGGGDTGGGDDGDITVVSDYILYYNGLGNKGLDSYPVTLSEQAKTQIEVYLSEINNPGCFIWTQLWSSGPNPVAFMAYSKDEVEEITEGDIKKIKNKTSNTISIYQCGASFTYDGNSFTINSFSGGRYGFAAGRVNQYSYVTPFFGDGSSGGDDQPVEGDWPEDDGTTESPTPPKLPEPKDPTIPNPPDPTTPGPDPTPTPKPDPVGPSLPDVPGIEQSDSHTADLQGILDALDEHCIHIQTCLNANFSSLNTYLGELFSIYSASIIDAIYATSEAQVSAIGLMRDDLALNVRQQIAWLGSDIDLNFDALLQYLNDLWEWLEDTLVFDFTGDTYDDSSLISWLQKIYDKMGDGINTQPVDVVVNPTDTGSWLDQFLASFFGGLLGNLAQVLADAAGTMAALTGKFPLSLPWDIAAILGLLVAPPVCPEFSFPCYSLTASGLEQVGSYDVSLEDVEFAVEGIRWMMRLGFVLVLAKHTKDFMELIERVID